MAAGSLFSRLYSKHCTVQLLGFFHAKTTIPKWLQVVYSQDYTLYSKHCTVQLLGFFHTKTTFSKMDCLFQGFIV